MYKSQKVMRIIQRALAIAIFAGMIACVLYSLIFMTPFYDLYVYDGTFLFKMMETYGLNTAEYISKYQNIEGALTYNVFTGVANGIDMSYFTSCIRLGDNNLQDFNHWIFNVGIIGIVVSLTIFIFQGQKRKRYYLSNFITIGLVAAFDFYIGFSLIFKIANAKELVGSMDFALINAYESSVNLFEEVVEHYSMATFNWVFNLGYVIAVVIMIVAALFIAYLVYKFIYQSKNPELDLSEVKINE